MSSHPESHTTRGCGVPTRPATTMQTPKWCPLRAGLRATNLSTPTRPPASLHTGAAARSTGNPNTAALEHAGAIHVKNAATSACARGQWEWEKEASTQPHGKWLVVESGRSTCRQSCQCRRCQRAALRSYPCADKVCESGPQLHPQVLLFPAS